MRVYIMVPDILSSRIFTFYSCYFTKYLLNVKGQIISKCLFGVFNFFQKTNKIHLIVIKMNSFICFFGKNHGLTICFRIYLTFRPFMGLKDDKIILSFIFNMIQEIIDRELDSSFKKDLITLLNSTRSKKQKLNGFCVMLSRLPIFDWHQIFAHEKNLQHYFSYVSLSHLI